MSRANDVGDCMNVDSRLLSELRDCVADRFEVSRPMPGDVYHSSSFAALERERIFHQEWICLGRVSDFAREGSFVTETIGDVSVLAVRQSDGTIKAFLNACAHRFARLVNDRDGARKLFVCPYHAWAYDGAGRLVRAPHMEASDDFDPGAVSLRQLHTDVWQGFVYVSLARERPTPLSERLERVTSEVIGQYGMEHYETVIQDEMPVAANWKNMIENFIESYHIFAVHAATFGTAGKDPNAYICGADMDHCAFHWSAKSEEEGMGAAHASNTSLNGEWRRTTVVGSVFPCHLITLAPDYMWSVAVLPVSSGEMRAVWSVSVAPEILADLDAAERDAWISNLRTFMDAANNEDKPVIEALWNGTQMTPGNGFYHKVERNLWNFATYIKRMTAD